MQMNSLTLSGGRDKEAQGRRESHCAAAKAPLAPSAYLTAEASEAASEAWHAGAAASGGESRGGASGVGRCSRQVAGGLESGRSLAASQPTMARLSSTILDAAPRTVQASIETSFPGGDTLTAAMTQEQAGGNDAGESAGSFARAEAAPSMPEQMSPCYAASNSPPVLLLDPPL